MSLDPKRAFQIVRITKRRQQKTGLYTAIDSLMPEKYGAGTIYLTAIDRAAVRAWVLHVDSNGYS